VWAAQLMGLNAYFVCIRLERQGVPTDWKTAYACQNCLQKGMSEAHLRLGFSCLIFPLGWAFYMHAWNHFWPNLTLLPRGLHCCLESLSGETNFLPKMFFASVRKLILPHKRALMNLAECADFECADYLNLNVWKRFFFDLRHCLKMTVCCPQHLNALTERLGGECQWKQPVDGRFQTYAILLNTFARLDFDLAQQYERSL
jgi:hypothetical protein